jgi:hypothetical protein
MRSPAPAPPIAASLILPAIFLGSNYVPMRPYGLIFCGFFFFSIVFELFFLLFSSFSSLLFNFYLFVSSYILTVYCIRDMIINDIHIPVSIILRDFSWGPSLF